MHTQDTLLSQLITIAATIVCIWLVIGVLACWMGKGKSYWSGTCKQFSKLWTWFWKQASKFWAWSWKIWLGIVIGALLFGDINLPHPFH